MNFDFSKPQRQSAVGIIIMAAETLRQVIGALVAPLVIAIIKFDKGFFAYFGSAILVVLIANALYAYFSYLKFTFYLDDQKQEFVINKGIFSRTQLTIQLDKIQQVNINQNLLQKIIGVYGLKIDTPGADGDEVSIKAIPQALAHSLREHLLSRKNRIDQSTAGPQIIEQQDLPFLKVGASTLLKVGLTSNYGRSIMLVIAFLYPLYHTAKELLNGLNMDEGQLEHAFKAVISFFSVGILVIGILLILLTINVVRTFVKYFELQLTQHKHSLLISAGLFAKKNTLLSPTKVQLISYHQNYFQRKLNLLNMNLKQADSGKAEKGKDLESGNLEIPGCNATERDQIMTMILGEVPSKGAVFIPNWRFLNLPIFFKVVLPIIIFLIFWLNFSYLAPYLPFVLAYGVIAIAMIYISYKRHRLMVTQDFIQKRSGICDVSQEILLPHKIQAITTFQYPWHKSVDVGHVNLHTAAGIIHFKYGNYTEIKKLVNYWLYQIESGSEEWM